ncbi:MAG TPA: ABC transporter permease [Clostridiaceae bacterium]|nr:ABC transporter permease [Clostridiaceae bacterium]
MTFKVRFVNHYKRRRDIYNIYALLLLFVIISSILDKDFLTLRNLTNIFTTNVPFLIAAYAQTIVILIGGVDLSIGACISLVTCIMATIGTEGGWWSAMPGIFISFLVCAVLGFMKGILITKFGIQALIATLSISLIIGGFSLAILDKPGGNVSKEFSKPFSSDISLFIICTIIFILIWFMLNYTKFGKYIYAVGGNSLSAYSAGINVDVVKISGFILSGFLIALAGVVSAASMRSGDPTSGEPLTLKSLTASIIGGASFSGGKGYIECTFAGVIIFAIINNILNLLGVSTFYQYIAQGLLLIFAIAITSIQDK